MPIPKTKASTSDWSTPLQGLGRVCQPRFRALGVVGLLLLGALPSGAALDFAAPQSRAPKVHRNSQGVIQSIDTGFGWVKKLKHTADGQIAELGYSRLGHHSGIELPATHRVRWQYDAGRRRTLLEDSTGQTKFEFNVFSAPSAVTYPDGSRLTFQYDPWQGARSIHLPNGRELRFNRHITNSVVRVTDGEAVVEYHYDAERRELTRTISNAVVSKFQMDESDNLVLIRHARLDGTLILELRYAHDDDGRVISIREITPAGEHTTRLEYDLLRRLIKSTRDGEASEHAYDPEGNRTLQRNRLETTRFEYSSGKLTQAGDVMVKHDRFGRVVEKTGPAGSTKYAYGLEGELVRVETDQDAVDFGYNGEGLRTKRSLNGNDTLFMHNVTDPLQSVIAEKNEQGFAYDIVGNSRVGRRFADGSLRFFLEDHLGSTRAMVDGKGNAVATYEYTDFGFPTRTSGTEDAPYLYTGEAWDAETGLLYLRNRYYDPQLGRFISPDPHPPTLENPQSVNRYAYCEGDPINQTDPLGLQPQHQNKQWLWLHQLQQTIQNMGRYVGAKHGEQSAQWYAQRYVDTGQWRYAIGGTFASAWTPETYWKTAATLGFAATVAPKVVTGLQTGIDSMIVRGALAGSRSEPFHLKLWENVLHYGVDGRGPHIGLLGSRALVHLRPEYINIFGPRGWDIPWSVVAAAGIGTAKIWNTATHIIDRGHANANRSSLEPPFQQQKPNSFFPPPPPPGSGGIPLVGGVYLDQSATILGALGNITGVVVDPKSGQPILIGDKDHSLPPMKPQLLAAAIRAVYSPSNENPGMTIDPNPSNPHSNTMLVRFFSHTEHTELGNIMFETDRLLKGFSVGRDNLNRTIVESQVSGYQNIAARSLVSSGSGTGLWSRFWIMPYPVTARVADSGIVFGPIRMRVQTETMRWASGKLIPAGNIKDPVAEAFAGHLTEHYDEFGREHPVFHELKQVTQVVALAKWLKERGVPANWAFVSAALSEPFPTPSTTPAAYNELEQTTDKGNLRIRIFGGVEMQPVIEGTKAPELEQVTRQVLEKVRAMPALQLKVIPVNIDGQSRVAAALPIINLPALQTFETSVTDVRLPMWASAFESLPGLARHYSSLDNAPSEFGRGWSLSIPRLEFEADPTAAPRTIQTIGFEGIGSKVQSQRFALVERGNIVRFESAFPDENLGSVGFAPTGDRGYYRGIYPEGENLYRLYFTNGNQAVFDKNGQLRAFFMGDAKAAYSYRNDGRLDSIEYVQGEREFKVKFTRNEFGRVTQVTAGNQQAGYEYTPAGDLGAVRTAERVTTYEHDSQHRPIRIAQGEEDLFLSFDSAGHVTKQRLSGGPEVRQSLASTPEGTTVTRKVEGIEERQTYDHQRRLVLSEDPSGTTRYEHAPAGHVSRVTTTSPGGGKTTVVLNSNGAPLSVETPAGAKAEWRYRAGQLEEAVINGQTFARLAYDRYGVSAVHYADGFQERIVRDAHGNVVSYARVDPLATPATASLNTLLSPAAPTTDPPSPRVTEDDQGRPLRIEGPAGSATLSYGPDSKLKSIEFRNGSQRQVVELGNDNVSTITPSGRLSCTFDKQRRPIAIRDALGNLTRYTYQSDGSLASIFLPGGRAVDCAAEGIPPVECVR